jgi:hypothetical protein
VNGLVTNVPQEKQKRRSMRLKYMVVLAALVAAMFSAAGAAAQNKNEIQLLPTIGATRSRRASDK